ncbi:MAG: formylglycine-generating enzyme family protein, partial [Rhizobiales bacterium]|nr:formylglycine-generating enzyme family protein [Hyphomicrobiales bacterium]
MFKTAAVAIAAGLLGLAAIFQASGPDMRAIAVVDGKTILMSRTEVTRGEWQACVDDDRCASLPAFQKQAGHNYPMTGISYFDAMDYVSWLNETTGDTFRLPTAEEWQLAAKELPKPVRKKLFDDPRLAWAAEYGAMPNVPRTLRESGEFGTFSNGIADLGGNV